MSTTIVSDSGAVIRTSIRTARTAHKCSDCGAEIRPGDQYNETAYITDGVCAGYKWCDECSWAPCNKETTDE